MTIDLKFLIIPAMPFAVLGVLRALWFASGAEWTESALMAFLCGLGGVFLGVLLVAMMDIEGIKWPLKIGGKP